MDVFPSTIEFSGYIFREDAFGIIKRLHFFLKNIEAIRGKFDLNINEIKILDIGCGTGIAVTIPLANIGYDIRGIDVDKSSINKANIMTKNIPNISFSCQELTTLDSSGRFHIVICSEVLEHLEKPDILLKQMKEVLVDNGLLLITVPNGYGYFELESLFYDRFPNFVSYIDLCQQALVERYGSKALLRRHKIERSPDYCNVARSSLDEDTIHCNKFTSGKIKSLLGDNDYNIIEFKNRTFLAGNIINILLRESDNLLSWNGKIADYLPKWMCSDWLIASKK
jgi:SAM-dependent methyltransferase